MFTRLGEQEAEKLYMRSLKVKQQLLGPEHPDVATLMNNVAELMTTEGRCA